MSTTSRRIFVYALLTTIACGGGGSRQAQAPANNSSEVSHSPNLERVSDPVGFSIYVPKGAKRTDRGFADGGNIEYEFLDLDTGPAPSTVNIRVSKATASGREVIEHMAGQPVHLPNGDLFHSNILWFFVTSCCTVQVVAQGNFAGEAKEIATSFEATELKPSAPDPSARAMLGTLVLRKDQLRFSLKLPPEAKRGVRAENGGLMLAGASTEAPVKSFVEYTIPGKLAVGIERDPDWPGPTAPPPGKLETIGRGERIKIRTRKGHYVVECARFSAEISKETLEAICASFQE